MAQIIKDGKIYTLYEMPTETGALQLATMIATESRKQEKQFREADWKQRARKNYRKK